MGWWRRSILFIGLGLTMAAGCASDGYTRLFHVQDKEYSLLWEDIRALDRIGPTLFERGVTFGVPSARAERIELLLFDDPAADLLGRSPRPPR